jgi:hypothetical protein
MQVHPDDDDEMIDTAADKPVALGAAFLVVAATLFGLCAVMKLGGAL